MDTSPILARKISSGMMTKEKISEDIPKDSMYSCMLKLLWRKQKYPLYPEKHR
jgi:hypothetical protein